MPLIEREGDRIWVTAEPREHEAVKLVPGCKWDAKRRQFRFALSWAACLQLRGVFGENLTVGPELAAWSLVTREQKDQLRYLASVLELPNETWKFIAESKLYPPQIIGTEFMLLAGGAIIGDEMGGGKTPQICVGIKELLAAHPGRRCLIVAAKSSLELVWAPHVREWVGVEPAMMVGNITQRRKALASDSPVVLISYDVLLHHTRLVPYGSTHFKRCEACLRPSDPRPDKPIPPSRCEAHKKELNDIDWLCVVADEAHKVKEPTSKRTRSLKAVMWPAPWRWLATGTPMANHEADFWSLLNAVDRVSWPSRTAYIDRYVLQGWAPWGGLSLLGLKAETAKEFYELVSSIMIRRPRAVLMPWLPKALPDQIREVELPRKLRETYNQMRDDLIAAIDGGLVLAPNPLTNTIRLRQLACSMLEQGEDGKYRMVEPSPKLDDLEDVLAELGDDEPVVVFAELRQLIELAEIRLRGHGITCSVFTGGQSDAENNAAMAAWKEGRTRVLMMTLAKGGESLTLTRAHVMVYIQETFSKLMMDQSKDRIDRDGQTQAPLRIRIRSRDTVEERVANVLQDKGARFENLVRDRERLKELL